MGGRGRAGVDVERNTQPAERIGKGALCGAVRCRSPVAARRERPAVAGLLQNGMSVENIARFLGHGCLESTQIYTHIINR